MYKSIFALSLSALISIGNIAMADPAVTEKAPMNCPNKTYFCAGASQRGLNYCDPTLSTTVSTCWNWEKGKCQLCINSQTELNNFFTTKCQNNSFYDTTTNATIQLTEIIPQHQCTNLNTSAPAPAPKKP